MKTANVTAIAAIALLVASAAQAELRHVEMKTLGMD
jgi:hypothetical protein